MPRHILEKSQMLILPLMVAVSIIVSSFAPAVLAAPTVPSTNNYPYTYDPFFNTRNSNCWQAGPNPRSPQNLPEGYWYPNVNFDSAWFGQNYARVQGDGKAYLYSVSTYDLLWGGRGWSNSFVHQGRVPYAGGIYEGRFKAGSTSGSAIPVDGIRYDMNMQEPVGKHYLIITARLTQDDLNCWQSNNGLLVSFLFQYEFPGGILSAYDSTPGTNNMQSLHVDVFIHRVAKFANIRFPLPTGWSYTLGDKYNADIHMQYVYNSEMQIGQWYTFYIDYGGLLNQIKSYLYSICDGEGLPRPQAIILRYIQVSAETIGGAIGAEIDDLLFTT